MEKINLVDKAKNIKPERTPYKITPEVIDLALAWKNDEVSIGQIQKALNIKEPNKIYAILARALKQDKPSQKKSEEKPTNKASVKALGKTADIAPSKY